MVLPATTYNLSLVSIPEILWASVLCKDCCAGFHTGRITGLLSSLEVKGKSSLLNGNMKYFGKHGIVYVCVYTDITEIFVFCRFRKEAE